MISRKLCFPGNVDRISIGWILYLERGYGIYRLDIVYMIFILCLSPTNIVDIISISVIMYLCYLNRVSALHNRVSALHCFK